MQLSRRKLAGLVRSLEKQGARARETRKGWWIALPDGSTVGIHRSQSDSRSMRNVRADIERAGLQWPGL